MSVRDIILAAREHLMIGMQLEITKITDPIVRRRAEGEFRRIEKYLGFEPNSWRSTP